MIRNLRTNSRVSVNRNQILFFKINVVSGDDTAEQAGCASLHFNATGRKLSLCDQRYLLNVAKLSKALFIPVQTGLSSFVVTP